MNPAFSGERIQALDGLRGIAALGVVLCHVYPQQFFWMWSFVDLFFVLSGYLITRILLNENWDTPTLSLKRFWLKRILRIWPLYYLTLLLCLLVHGLRMSYGVAEPPPQGLWSALFFMQYADCNLTLSAVACEQEYGRFILNFTHSWTLAIEEQFYLLWPLVIWALRNKPLRLLALCLTLIACQNWLRLSAEVFPRALLSRSDGLAWGALLALWQARRIALPGAFSARLCKWLLALLAGAALLHCSTYIWQLQQQLLLWPDPEQAGRYNQVVGSFAIVFAALIYGLLSGRLPLLERALASPALVHLGLLSYAIYLFHVPLLAPFGYLVAKLGSSSVVSHGLHLGYLLVLILLAQLSRLTFEAYFVRLRKRLLGNPASPAEPALPTAA